MRVTIEQTTWENIPSSTPGTGDEARERIATVMEQDPCVRMLSPEIRGCMVEAFGNALIYDKPYPNHVASASHGEIKRLIKPVVKAMPLGFLTDGFVEHVLGLVAFAIMPHPEYDEWSRPR